MPLHKVEIGESAVYIDGMAYEDLYSLHSSPAYKELPDSVKAVAEDGVHELAMLEYIEKYQ